MRASWIHALLMTYTCLLGCRPAKYASLAPGSSGGDTAADTAAPDLEFDGFSVLATWDGSDALQFDWPEVPDARYTFQLEHDGTVVEAREDMTDLTVTISGLADGEYTATVEPINPADEPITRASVAQLVGDNRLVYRSELPLRRAMDVWGSGDIAVIGGGTNDDISALVVDVTDANNPEIIHTLRDIGYVRDIKVWDNLLFTAVDPDADGCTLCDDIGVRIYDFSDPSQPTLLSTIDSPASWVHNMSYSDGYLYLASTMEEVVAIVDVRDPTNPTRVAAWYPEPSGARYLHGGPGGSHDMMAQGDRLYVAHFSGFSVVDISDPTRPAELASVRVDMGMHNVWPNQDGTLLVGSQEILDGPLTLWDISDLSSIQQLDSLSTAPDRCVHNGYFDGDTVFAAWYIDGIYSFEIADGRFVQTGHHDTFPVDYPPPPEDVEPLPPIEGAWGLWSFGEHLIVGDTERGMMIFDHFPDTIMGRPGD